MKTYYISALLMTGFLSILLTGCGVKEQSIALKTARSGFKTTLRPQQDSPEPVEKAPPSVFRTLKYPAQSGELSAYLSTDSGDGQKHPAIVWITGGDCNSIGDVWSPASRDNNQTGDAFRNAGIVMMFPSLRGGNDNPGKKEGFLGEVDDILAATKYLETQPYVDPKRIYLGGHSTGGTMALLVAECTNRFRGVFSYGPVADVGNYGADSGFLPFDLSNKQEIMLRSPGYWLKSIQSPVWVFEGTGGNIESLRDMRQIATNPKVHFIEIRGASHFSTLAPTNELIARKILQDTGATSTLAFSADEVNQNFTR